MAVCRTYKRIILCLFSLVAVLLISSCAGVEPYDPPNYREEPPVQGLLTGEEGEFVIYRKAEEPETGREAGNTLK